MPWRFPLLTARRARLDMSRFAPVPDGGYLVGGAVRDGILGRVSRDLDWLVEDAAHQAAWAAERVGGRPFPLDDERGHWRLITSQGRTLDFIPMRGSLEEDLRSRDFTVNALAAMPDGRIIDLQRGLHDLNRKLLRATSEQALRDDPLRLLRAVRLSAQLDFEIEQGTRAAIQRGAQAMGEGALLLPAWERIRDELDGIVSSPLPGSALSELEGLGLLEVVLPELAAGRGVDQPGFHHLDVLDHSFEAVQRLSTIFPEADIALRWATLLHDVGKPLTRERGDDGRLQFYGHDKHGSHLAQRAMKRLRRPRREVERIAGLVRYHMLPLPKDDRQARRFVHRRRDLLPDLLKLMVADREAARGPLSSEGTRRAYRTALSRVVGILEEAPPPEPLLDGNEVMELLDLPPGPRVGEALKFLSEARAVGDIADRSQALQALREFAQAQGWLE